MTCSATLVVNWNNVERAKTSFANVVKGQTSAETATCAVAESAWRHRANHAKNISAPIAIAKKAPLLPRIVRYARNRTADFVFQFVQ